MCIRDSNDGVLTYEEFQKEFIAVLSVEETTPKKTHVSKQKAAAKKVNEFPKLSKEEDLVKRLEEQIEKYRGLESIKIELIEEKSYNLVDTFRTLFDSSCKGYVTFEAFYERLEELGVASKASLPEVSNFLQKQCTEMPGKITYADFCEMMMPHDVDLGQILCSRKSSCYDPSKSFTFSGKVRMLLKLFFTLLSQLAAECEGTVCFFVELTRYLGEGKASVYSLRKFLDRHRIMANDSELVGIFEMCSKMCVCDLSNKNKVIFRSNLSHICIHQCNGATVSYTHLTLPTICSV
eukprot:TRINITY_DN24558_c0_g1_i1.p1 TRINITY_DN24558_c0_g1~~TRINITY_DN24558_c0_g1_i1.p1  ORF type:complete len:293 (-),score=73.57 TRINITY_DN24558_c0_g1_i1:34-912(-)